MSRVATTSGFTIVETLIVLAVTGLLFLAVAAGWSGKQHSSEYQAAIGQTQASLQQVVSDVQNGYFQDVAGFKCVNSVSNLTFSASGGSQGTNLGCIFLGKAVQFKVDGITNPEKMGIYTVAAAADATSVVGANPTIAPQHSEFANLPGDLTTVKMKRTDNNDTNFNTVAFLSDYGSYDGTTLQSGRQTVGVYAIKTIGDGNLGQARPADDGSGNAKLANNLQPITGSILVCFKSGGTSHYDLVTIANTGTISSKTTDNDTCGIT